MMKVQLSPGRGYYMGPHPEGRWETRSEPPGCHINPHPVTFSLGPGRTHSEQGGLGICLPSWSGASRISGAESTLPGAPLPGAVELLDKYLWN